jgi:hypothetical protein
MARTKTRNPNAATQGKQPRRALSNDSDSEREEVELGRQDDELKATRSSTRLSGLEQAVSEMVQKCMMPWLVVTLVIDDGFPHTLWIPYNEFSLLLKKYLPQACAGSPLLDLQTSHHNETWYPADAPEAAELKELWRKFGIIHDRAMQQEKNTGAVNAERMVGWTMTIVRR